MFLAGKFSNLRTYPEGPIFDYIGYSMKRGVKETQKLGNQNSEIKALQ